MSAKFLHTNIVSKDVEKLALFYHEVFGLKQVGPASTLQGNWLEKGTGVKNPLIKSINLLMPGSADDGPKLEIFQYGEHLEKDNIPAANRIGYGHLAFDVNDVEKTVEKAISHGGKKLGRVARKEFKSGILTFIYITDPEGNIVEISSWQTKK